jgi:predicted dinucleotide-binding enzyme
MKKVAVLGSGQVGEVLANGFLKHGFAVMRASREPAKFDAWKSGAKGDALTGTFADAAKWGDVIVLAVKGSAAESALEQAGIAALANKLVIDTTNPIADAPPQNGVIVYFTNANESLMERLQKKAPQARFVKAFNSVGSAFMIDPEFELPPSMFICGNDAAAKAETTEILGKLGWEAVDMGPVEAARPIEALCQLWCLPGFLRNDWAHAFKYMKPA